MELGAFDDLKAKEEAKAFLVRSITTLSHLLNVDYTSIKEDTLNPFEEGDARRDGFNCLKNEIEAYRKLN